MPDSGNDNVQIQGLEFVIKTVAEKADGLKEVANGLKSLETSVKGLPKVIEGMQKLSGALSTVKNISAEPFRKLADALRPLSEIGKIHIQFPKNFPEQMQSIQNACQNLNTEHLENTAQALHYFDGLQLPKIPTGFVNSLAGLSDASYALQPEKIQKLGESLQSISGIQFQGDFAKNGDYISSFSKSLSAIASVSSASSQIDAGKLYSLIPALKAFQGLNFSFAPYGLVSALKDIVSAGNAVTNDTVNNLYRLSNAVKMFENFNMTNAGSFRELGEALSSFSYFYIPDEFANSMQYIKDGIKVFESVSEADIKKIAQLTILFNNMPTDEMTNFYNVLDSFGSATRDLTELGKVNLAPVEHFLKVISEMNMAGEVAIAPEFIESIRQLLDVSKGIDVTSLDDLLRTLLNFGKHGKNFNFSFPTGFADFARDLKKAFELFPHNRPEGLINFVYAMEQIGNIPHLRSIADLFTAFGSLETVHIAPELVAELNEITEYVRTITSEDIDKIKDYADALKYLGDMSKGVKVPKSLKVPKVEGTEEVEKTKSKFEELYEKMPEWAKIAGSSLQQVNEKFSIMQGIIDGVKGKIAGWVSEISSISEALPEGTPVWVTGVTFALSKLAQGFDMIVKKILDVCKNIFTFQNAMKVLKSVANGVATAIQASFKAISALDNAILSIPKRIEKLISSFRKAVKSVERFVKSIQKAVKNVKKIVESIKDKLFSPFENAFKKITKFISSLQRIALYRAIRRGIQLITQGFQEGMENLYQYSLLIDGDFHKSMDSIATDALYVRNSLAAMISPLINALAPVIDTITDKFVNLLNIVNQTFSALTGKDTYTAARKFQTEWQEAEKATKDAGGTVKDTLEEIKRYTLGFDELNILGEPDKDTSKNSKDKGTSADDVKDYLSMFQELPVENTIGDFFKKIQDAIKNGQFYEVGKMIAEKMTAIIKSIPFKEWGEWIGEKINNAITVAKGFLDFADFVTLGSGVAKFLNKAFEKIEFHNLGAVLAGKIRLAIQFAYGFVSEFHFKDFGKDLGEMVSGFILSIDFDKAISTLQWGFEGILDTVYGFLTKLQAFAIGVKIRKALSLVDLEGITSRFGFIAEELKLRLQDFLQGLGIDIESEGIDISGLGAKLGTWLTNAFEQIPYEEIGTVLGKVIQNAISNMRGIWDNLDTRGLGSGLATLFNHLLDEIDTRDIGVGIGEKIRRVLEGLVPFINTLDWDSVFGSVYKVADGFFDMMDSPLAEIDLEKMLNPLTENFDKIVARIVESLGIAFNNAGNITLIGSAIGKMINSVLSGLSTLLSGLDTDAGADGISALIDSILDEIEPENFSTVLNHIITDGLHFVVKLLKNVDFKEVGSAIGQALADLDVGSILGDFASGLTTGIGGILGTIGGFLFGSDKDKEKSSPFSGLKDKSDEFKKYIQDTMGETETSVSVATAGMIGSGDALVSEFDADSVSWGNTCKAFQDNFNAGMDEIVKKHRESREKSKQQWALWQESFNETIDKFRNGFKNAGVFIKNTIKSSLNGCIGVVEGFVNAWITGFNDIADVINSFSIDIPSWVPVLGGNSWSPNMPKFEQIQLARYDKGGFPNSGDLFFANENGSPELVGRMGNQTAVANTDQIVEGIAQGVMMAMNSGSQNQLIRQAITLLQAIAEKNTTVEVTTGQINKAQDRKNHRDGVTTVPA